MSPSDPVRVDKPEAPSVPDPLSEEPPADRFCDLVLNGGVASGVVYPWALLELARRYRFRSIGGNSVGAMAAAMAAAAEYGRCTGVEDSFEPLRLFPLKLAEEKNGLPLMLRLFQPSPGVRRLFGLFLLLVRASEGVENMAPAACPKGTWWMALVTLYGLWLPLALASTLVALVMGVGLYRGLPWTVLLVDLILFGAAGVALVIASWLLRILADCRSLAGNFYGLCTGRSQGTEEALVEWLHRGIQCSAGRGEEDPPLSFADLWAAPRFGRPGPLPLAGGLQPDEPGISLQMFSSNVTQGRPIRLPLNDADTRLFYYPGEWREFFPDTVMKALELASIPYAPASSSDPRADIFVLLGEKPHNERDRVRATDLLELPRGGMPLVVAARLSLSFPLLFSCVPVYAIDYEVERDSRTLRRCLLSDGGLCCNFPVHLFDAPHPRWPTFGLLLDSRRRWYGTEAVWLPQFNTDGRGDEWQRDVPGADNEEDSPTSKPRSPLSRLASVAAAMFSTAKDWNDRVTSRLPTHRNRIVRLALQRGEGQLNIAMPGSTMLRMANEYGIESASKLIEQFAPPAGAPASQGWRDHVYVRAVIELRSLRSHLKRYGESVRSSTDMVPLRELLAQVTCRVPLSLDERLGGGDVRRPLAKAIDRVDIGGDPLSPPQRDALLEAIDAVESLERKLAALGPQFGPYIPVPVPEMHLRPPV